MAEKHKSISIIKNRIKFSFTVKNTVSYADYYLRRKIIHGAAILNENDESIKNLNVVFSSDCPLIIGNNFPVREVPYQSSVGVDADNLLSPLYLAECAFVTNASVTAQVRDENGVLATENRGVTVLPLNYWGGLNSGAEDVIPLIRPNVKECSALLREAEKQLSGWDSSSDTLNYQGNDKNAVRLIAAAVYSAIKSLEIEKSETEYLSPVPLTDFDSLATLKKADPLSLAMLAVGCFEQVGLNCVLFIGKDTAAVGVWLYNSCFMDTSDDDFSIIENYCSDGMNNLSCFAVEDLFSGGRASYALSEKHFKAKMEEGAYLVYADVKRCRLAGYKPLPVKISGENGYEMVAQEDSSPYSKPQNIAAYSSVELENSATKNKQWERRLLDLSLKNTLLNFNFGRGVLHMVSAGADATYSFVKSGEYLISPVSPDFLSAAEVNFKSETLLTRQAELISAENKNGIIRTFSDGTINEEVLNRLVKKSKNAFEESGCKILYLAFGFLKWYEKGGRKEKYAPLCLLPVAIKKGSGNSGFALSADEDSAVQLNSTLFEFLKQEFNIDARGIEKSVSSLSLSQIFALVRRSIGKQKGWDISEDVYLSVFSFAKYTMWRDIRENIGEFQKNPLISSLMQNSCKVTASESEYKNEDSAYPTQTLTPLPCDSSQFEAVAYSQSGNTFVLHGPPGTGKSQTITNIIANAINDGKQVLFVAEKQAALDVVKKRLDGIGLGDFCLELHSSKTGKVEVLKKLAATLSLKNEGDGVDLEGRAAKLASLRRLIEEPHSALHAKRRLGISVYEGVLEYLKNKNAPDILNIQNSFYDSLTKENLYEYEQMISSAIAAADECGGVAASPFKNVNITEYSVAARDSLYCSSQVMLNEIRNVKSYLNLFLALYRQKVSKLSREKLKTVGQLSAALNEKLFLKYFACTEDEFGAFYRAETKLYCALSSYNKSFKKLVRLPRDPEEFFKQYSAAKEGKADIKKCKAVYPVYKALKRAYNAAAPFEGDVYGYLKVVYDLASAKKELAGCVYSDKICGKICGFSFKKNDEFFSDLKKVYKMAETVFMDYNAAAFNSCCIRAACGYTSSALTGLINALSAFKIAEDSFLSCISADRNALTGDDFDDLLEYYRNKASALIENVDKLSGWCSYKSCVRRLDEAGLKFVGEAMEEGRYKPADIITAFRKNVYNYFVETNVSSDPVLSSFSAAVLVENIEKYRLMSDEFSSSAKQAIRYKLIASLPNDSTEGAVSAQLSYFRRAFKSGGRGVNLRELFAEIPDLIKKVAPCLLMSPVTVSQYLAPTACAFDAVIFDEASQMPTSEAVPAIARARSAIIVGDPKQLPPTTFFASSYSDEDNPESEDMESVLDDALALGLPERYLTWHYRSKHESLIAFSNIMYYDGMLRTFPSPDALDSKVRLVKVEDGEYERGGKNRNSKEADRLIAEVVRRLSDSELKKQSIGIVTFSNVQKEYIERQLTKVLAKNKLEEAAYDVEEPLFVKNLENVQGDERDVILFSVCYGPDAFGRLSLNFGPLNQAGGWRRLNVAVSRARSEMMVFSSMTSAMIDLSRTSSKGVAGLKAFLEFADRGKVSLAMNPATVTPSEGIGKYIADELSLYGYDCRHDVGVSEFKIDVAVVDPFDKHKFILAILLDGSQKFSVKDRNILQVQTLKRNNWNVTRIFSENYYANPKREIQKLKELIDKLTKAETGELVASGKYREEYKTAAIEPREENIQYILSGENDTFLTDRLKQIILTEQPITEGLLIKRLCSSLGIAECTAKAEAKIKQLISRGGFLYIDICSERNYYIDKQKLSFKRYRVESGENKVRSSEWDVSAYDIISLVRGVLEERVAVRVEELAGVASAVFSLPHPTDMFVSFVSDLATYGENKGMFIRSVTDRLSIA